jgi:hypothetical protein
MTSPTRRTPAVAVSGLVLVALGMVLWALYRYTAGHEEHAYAPSGSSPHYAQLSSGKTYWLAIPGGVASEATAGLDPAALRCTATGPTGDDVSLSLATEHADSKATDQIASFIAPFSGRGHVSCRGLGSVYVDNASGDPSGYLLVGGIAALTIGLPLLLSGLRTLRAGRPAKQPAAAGPAPGY